jgi:hypothetical protein
MRKNIFEIMLEDFNVDNEIKVIWALFLTKSISTNYDYKYTLSEVMDKNGFEYWEARGRSVSCSDMAIRLGINSLLKKQNWDMNEAFIILEYVMNIYTRCDKLLRKLDYKKDKNCSLLWENCNTFIEHFGYENIYIKEEQKLLIVEKNPATTAAAEISTNEIARQIIEYNHYTLKGDIVRKKEIIINLANEIEPKRESLKQIYSSISNDLYFLLNNLNLRHNNIDPNDTKHYREYVAKMNGAELEKWYDETYQLILLSKLLLDNVNRNVEIKTLKDLIK